MVQDDNVRSLVQVITFAKVVIDAGRFEAFLSECFGRDDLFVIATSASRNFVADFAKRYSIDPRGKTYQVTPPERFDLDRFMEERAATFNAHPVLDVDRAARTASIGYGRKSCNDCSPVER